MKLKGKNVKHIPEKKRKRMEKTLKRMNKIRKNDNIRLRKNIKEKLEWAIEQKKKGLEAIESWKKSIQINTGEILKLNGSILVLTQLLEESNIKEKK